MSFTARIKQELVNRFDLAMNTYIVWAWWHNGAEHTLHQYVLWYLWTLYYFYSSNLPKIRPGGAYWIGLAKTEEPCNSTDWRCRRQNWKWQDGSPYTSYQITHLWYSDYLEPDPYDLHAQLGTNGWYGSQVFFSTASYICEKGRDRILTICCKRWQVHY